MGDKTEVLNICEVETFFFFKEGVICTASTASDRWSVSWQIKSSNSKHTNIKAHSDKFLLTSECQIRAILYTEYVLKRRNDNTKKYSQECTISAKLEALRSHT